MYSLVLILFLIHYMYSYFLDKNRNYHNFINCRSVFLKCTRCTWCAFVLNTERKSAFATPRIFVHRTITPMYTPWETHDARVVDSSNENIMERSKRFYEGEKDP